MRNSQKLMIYGGLAAIIGTTGFVHGIKGMREQQQGYEISIDESDNSAHYRMPHTDIYEVELVLGAMTGLVGGILAQIGYSTNKEVKERLEKISNQTKMQENVRYPWLG